jgi:hypothetical protein
MVVHFVGLGTVEVSAGVEALHPAEEVGAGGQEVFEGAVPVTDLAHQDTPALFYNVSPNDAGAVFEPPKVFLASQNRVSYLNCTAGAKGVCGSWNPQWWERSFATLEEPSRSPVRLGEFPLWDESGNGLGQRPG